MSKIIVPSEPIILTATADTYLKAWPYSAQLLREEKGPNQLKFLANGTKLELVDLEHYLGGSKTAGFKKPTAPHYAIQLEDNSRWFVYAKHATESHTESAERTQSNTVISEDEKKDAAIAVKKLSKTALKDEKAASKDLGKLFKFHPSLKSVARGRYEKEPIRYVNGVPIPFTWGELMQGDARRLPYYAWELQNTFALGDYLTHIRKVLGQPLRVNSGPRPEPVNAEVGGAPGSYHTKFVAADIFPVVDEITYDIWRRICRIQRSDGLATANTFIHVECPKSFGATRCRGYRTSWAYGNGPRWRRL